MNRFVDIHQHVIYGVDDGPRTEEEMQQMLLRAASENVGDIVCTSHATPGAHRFPAVDYQHRIRQAQAFCDAQGLPLKLHNGCEVLYTDSSARLLKEGQMPSLADTWNLLVEFSPDADFHRLCEAARSLGTAGFTVLFAHVERYQALRSIKHVRQLRDEYGVYMQMNANTVISRKGFFFDRWVRTMLDEGYIDCVGSDAHNVTNRACNMKLCYEALCRRYGEDVADELCGGFQRELLGL